MPDQQFHIQWRAVCYTDNRYLAKPKDSVEEANSDVAAHLAIHPDHDTDVIVLQSHSQSFRANVNFKSLREH